MFTERAYHGRRVLARDLEKHHKASMAFDERHDVRVVCSGEKISFPVAWHSAVLCHRQWETDPLGTLNLTHRVRWFLREGGADAEGGGADGIGGFEEARG